jgi:hypothetical protein
MLNNSYSLFFEKLQSVIRNLQSHKGLMKYIENFNKSIKCRDFRVIDRHFPDFGRIDKNFLTKEQIVDLKFRYRKESGSEAAEGRPSGCLCVHSFSICSFLLASPFPPLSLMYLSKYGTITDNITEIYKNDQQ